MTNQNDKLLVERGENMNALTFLYLMLLLFAGIVIGFIFGKMERHNTIGTLRIDSSDPDDGPYMFLELAANPEYIKQQKRITLDVSTQSYISQE